MLACTTRLIFIFEWESLHVPLTTQLYFRDDPYIAKDHPWASRKPSLAIGLKQDGNFLHGTFDLVLARGF